MSFRQSANKGMPHKATAEGHVNSLDFARDCSTNSISVFAASVFVFRILLLAKISPIRKGLCNSVLAFSSF